MENREIKFRAYQDNQMIISPISSNYGLNRFFGMLYEDTKVMQYTGLKDRNGKEIYEGDIIKHTWRTIAVGKYFQSDDAYCEHEQVLQIKFIAPSYRFFAKDGKQYSLTKNGKIEIIGNIYENPELLK